MSLRVIGVTGFKRVGKTTFSKAIIAQYEAGTIYTASMYSFAKPLKEACHILFGGVDDHWYGDLKEVELKDWVNRIPCEATPRRILQHVGTELFRDMMGQDFWVNVARTYIKDMRTAEGMSLLIIDDVRFDNEAKFLCEEYNATIVKLNRVNDPTINVGQHASEKGISSKYIDYIYNFTSYEDHPGFAADCLRRMGLVA